MSRTQEERRQFWLSLIRQQEQSGQSVRAYCKQHRTSEHSFYQWRKRIAERLPMKFALVETNRSAPAAVAAVEVNVPMVQGQYKDTGCLAGEVARDVFGDQCQRTSRNNFDKRTRAQTPPQPANSFLTWRPQVRATSP
jgi:hypothetical protein